MNSKSKMKKGVAILAASTLVLTYAQLSNAESSKQEKIPAWASAEISVWKDLGLLKGDAQGFVLPGQQVTKAEFVTFINRVFGYAKLSDKVLKDVPPSAWYATEISKAYAAGILLGDAQGNIHPNEVLSREQAALILSRVFEVAGSGQVSSRFADDNQISSWSAQAVYAMKEAGYVTGTPQGEFQPLKALTRAEAVKMINNIMGQLIADSAQHAGIDGKNLVVNAAGGTLSGLHLTGNLYVAPGVGEGNLTIENSQIDGTIYVLGGGEHSVVLKDTKAKKLHLHKITGPVRVVLSGSTSIDEVDVLSGATIQNDGTSPVGNLAINAGSGDHVNIVGDFSAVNVNSAANLNVGGGNIGTLAVGSLADGTVVSLDASSAVGNLQANGGVNVTGSGSIEQATINANNVTIEQTPGKVVLNSDRATVGGKVITKDANGGGTGSTGSTGGTGGGSTPDMTTQLFTYEQATSSFSNAGAQGLVKQYLAFLQDPTYKPSVANPTVPMPSSTNGQTFVNKDFDVKPSLFASLRGVNTSVLDDSRQTLWIGTDNGVTKIKLADNGMTNYNKAGGQLKDDKVLLLIADGATGVYAITDTGVSHIKQ